MMCLENVADKVAKKLIPAAAKGVNRIADECQKRGLIVRPLAHMNILSPTLVFTRDHVDFAVKTLRESIEAATDSLKTGGYLPR